MNDGRYYGAYNRTSSTGAVSLCTVSDKGLGENPDKTTPCFPQSDILPSYVGRAIWTNDQGGIWGSEMNEDCNVYAHPQFGPWGSYILTRSFNHYTKPVPTLNPERSFGHPVLTVTGGVCKVKC
jgi:hypothetical protein